MKINDQVIKLNPFITQISPKRGKFRVVSVGIDLSMAPHWIGQKEKFHWKVIIKFLEEDKFEVFYFDYYDNCIKKEKLT